MALPATDNFNRADSGDLGTNWDVIFGDGFQITSNTAASNTDFGGGFDCAEIWNADSFGDDQYSKATVSGATGTGGASGLAVRGATDNYYGWYSDSANGYIFEVVGGSFNTFATGDAWSDSDDVELQVEGTTITPLRNGSEDLSVGAQTDSSLASGAAGLSGYGNALLNALDDWEGGDLGAVTGGVVVGPKHPRTNVLLRM